MDVFKWFGCLLILMVYSGVTWAIDCVALGAQEQMRAFLEKGIEGNPLYRKNFSSQLSISPCEKENCSKKNRAKRKEKESVIHSLQLDDRKRTFFMEGNDHPICVVSKSIRQFKCSECGASFNDQCRSFNTSSAIEGTNLDSIDMGLLVDPNFELSCKPVKKSTKFSLIEATKKGGDAPYDKIVVYFEHKRSIIIQIRYSAQNILRKVYRLSPKYFIQLEDDSWVSTDIKVRTVQGSEKKYTFETRIKVSKKGKKHVVNPNPLDDPYINGTSMDVLFSTN